MKKLIATAFFVIVLSPVYGTVQLDLYNQGYAYNDEDANGSYQPETMETITYFEDLFQPYIDIKEIDHVEFKAGCGFLLPFNQSEKIWDYFPYIQTKFSLNGWKFIVGSLENDHDMPPFMLDPLDQLIPDNRVMLTSNEDYYLTYGTNHVENIDPTNTMGYYQYGAQIRYNDTVQNFELYYNWQVQGTEDFRERFDVGLIYNYDMYYIAAHYWHNGGHEFQYGEEVTENYNIAAGLRNKNFSLLYTASEWLPNRDSLPQYNVFGQGIYAEYNFDIWDGLILTPQVFVSDSFIDTNDNYISVEGDPFYKCPFYFGLNLSKRIDITDLVSLFFGLVNGTYIPSYSTPYDTTSTRYDQEIVAKSQWNFDIIK